MRSLSMRRKLPFPFGPILGVNLMLMIASIDNHTVPLEGLLVDPGKIVGPREDRPDIAVE